MISPYVRRLRLGRELLARRQEQGMSSEQVGRATRLHRTSISRLENGQVRPDVNNVIKILDCLGVTGDDWTKLIQIAREAGERGWWESHAEEMGERQAMVANLEAGAASIREYHLTLIPGLLQTPEYTAARAAVDTAERSAAFNAARSIEARAARQRMLHRPGGPTYEVIVDELAVRRLSAAVSVMRGQLAHLAKMAQASQVTAYLLPVDVEIEGHTVPRSSFSIYTYPDPDDPVVVAVDTVTSDLVLTEPDQVGHYLALYERLRTSALAPAESARVLAKAAKR
ncbi:helix-turn-helix transcriptional regulator [Planosporangium flavigriseum]|uniref:Transcriptional regulator n=1 Tax=Planosporangium flavigriseum TaxID=373681 RepID=A0A8J3LWL7_9ACTN|nr:helix-turn-helix transcriptional regulator [Planosporangium flavigriseum]NJC66238.1 helix-turn-helix transcriptional regulator [Planosporangium flavigriseum]GIG74695.1 transcriptional regulator [Planosporangium flavigriseum]